MSPILENSVIEYQNIKHKVLLKNIFGILGINVTWAWIGASPLFDLLFTRVIFSISIVTNRIFNGHDIWGKYLQFQKSALNESGLPNPCKSWLHVCGGLKMENYFMENNLVWHKCLNDKLSLIGQGIL